MRWGGTTWAWPHGCNNHNQSIRMGEEEAVSNISCLGKIIHVSKRQILISTSRPNFEKSPGNLERS